MWSHQPIASKEEVEIDYFAFICRIISILLFLTNLRLVLHFKVRNLNYYRFSTVYYFFFFAFSALLRPRCQMVGNLLLNIYCMFPMRYLALLLFLFSTKSGQNSDKTDFSLGLFIGFDKKPFMPESRQTLMLLSSANAVNATMG